ncbi:hypothetical protein J5X84_32170 [Streptosporangiaceae bacterium NEAU-GS5]|nr:hypothetical protein [Streptosporangiaceae bacterium NEAU-GS5]
MNMDTQIRETLREWAQEARVPPGLAGRALRRRRRRRFIHLGTGLMAVAAAVAVALILPGIRGGEAPTGTIRAGDPTSAPTDIQTDIQAIADNAPPQRFVAAGRVAISAWSSWKYEDMADGYTVVHRTWHVYDPTTGTYLEVPYGVIAVAPGLRQAAVLEWPLPARRIGLLDLTTREVTAWIDLDHPVATVDWSPDGTKLLATAYDRDPTSAKYRDKARTSSTVPPIKRPGYYLVDAAARSAVFRSAPPPDEGFYTARPTPFQWSADGSRISEMAPGKPGRIFYDLDGTTVPPPPGWSREQQYMEAGFSPDGMLLAAAGAAPGPQTTVRDAATGAIVGTQVMEQLVAWADNDHLIALKCAGTCKNEFSNAYVLVKVDGTEVAQLTGYRENSQKPGSWEPVFTLR